jgi:hypothetical protein
LFFCKSPSHDTLPLFNWDVVFKGSKARLATRKKDGLSQPCETILSFIISQFNKQISAYPPKITNVNCLKSESNSQNRPHKHCTIYVIVNNNVLVINTKKIQVLYNNVVNLLEPKLSIQPHCTNFSFLNMDVFKRQVKKNHKQLCKEKKQLLNYFRMFVVKKKTQLKII